MAAPAAVLSVLVRANTSQATSALARFNTQVGATQGKASKMTSALKTVGKVGAVGAAGGIAYAVKKAADFEQQLDSLGSVTNATGREMGRLRKQAMKAGADTKFSALDAAKAQTELAKGGLSVSQIMRGGLKSALALAAAGELDLADAAETTANAVKLFGLEGKDTMKVADALATAANSTTADVSDFAMALKQGGGVAKMAGLSFTETVLALEALAETGVRNSDAGTSMKTAFIQLLKPSKKQAELAKELGLNFVSASGGMKSMSSISGMLRNKLGGMTKAQRTAALATLAGTDGVRTLNALYSAGPAKLDKMKAGLDKTGTAAVVAARKQDNLKGKLENLQGSIETIAIAIGSKMLPSLTAAAKKVTDILNDPKLTVSEKFQAIAQMAADAFEKAVPKVANAAASAAPKVAMAFVRGFANAGVWGKLAIGTFLLHKFGGLGAFTALGRKGGAAAGKGVSQGMAATTTAAPTVAKTTKGFGPRGPQSPSKGPQSPIPGSQASGAATGSALALGVRQKLGGQLKAMAPQMKALGKTAIGFSLVSGVSEGLTQKGGFGDKLQAFGHGVTFGLVPAPREIDQRLQTIATKIRTWKGSGQLKLSDPNDPANSLIRQKDLSDFDARSKRMLVGLAQLRNAATRHFGKGITLKANLDVAAAGRNAKVLSTNMNRLKSHLVFTTGEMAKIAQQDMRIIAQTMGANSRSGRAAVVRHMGASLTAVRDAMAGGNISARQGMKAIRDAFVIHSRASKVTTQKNFGLAKEAIKSAVRAGIITAQQGAREIARLFRSYLGQFGIKGREADIYLSDTKKSKRGEPLTVRQKGGLIPGTGSGDKVPVMAEPGEGFINKKAVRAMGGPKAVNAVNAAYPRFQGGGIVGLGRRLQKQGYRVGEHPAFGGVAPGVHSPTGYHPKGMAIDVNAEGMPGGEMAALDRLNARLKRMPGVVELLWRVEDHFDHLHVAMSGGGGPLGDIGATAAKIAQQKVGGPNSAMKTIVQGVLDKTRGAAQRKLNELAPAGMEGAESLKGFTGGGDARANRALGKRMAAAFGWRGAQWAALDDLWGNKESGWLNQMNKAGSGATGIPQALPGSKMASEGADWRTNPATQIRWGLKYIKGRFGTPSAALAFHRANNWYQQGGLVQMLQAGAVPGKRGGGARGSVPSLAEIKKQEKRVESLKTKLGEKKDTKGYSWAKKQGTKKQKKLGADLNRARSTLKGMKGQRKKGLAGRKKGAERLTKRVEGFKLPLNVTKGMEAGSAHIQDLNDLYDFFESDYRSTTITDAEGNEIELNQDELNDLVARKTQIRNLIGGDPLGSGGQMAHLRDAVIPMVRERIKGVSEFMQRLVKRVNKNMKELRAYLRRAERMRKSIQTIDRQVKEIRKKKKPTAADKKKLALLTGKKAKLAHDLNIITQRRIPGLEADNQLITGTKRPKTPLTYDAITKMSAGEGFILPDASAVLGPGNSTTGGEGGIDLQGFMAEFQEKLRPGGLQAEWKGHDIAIRALLKEGADKPKTGAGDESQTALAGLLKEQLQQAQLRTGVSEAQFKVLRDLPPFAGSFATGGIVPGPTGAPRSAIVHGGEAIGQPGDVQINFSIAPGMEWLKQFIRIEVDGQTRQMTRGGRTALPGRGGGNLV